MGNNLYTVAWHWSRNPHAWRWMIKLVLARIASCLQCLCRRMSSAVRCSSDLAIKSHCKSAQLTLSSVSFKARAISPLISCSKPLIKLSPETTSPRSLSRYGDSTFSSRSALASLLTCFSLWGSLVTICFTENFRRTTPSCLQKDMTRNRERYIPKLFFFYFKPTSVGSERFNQTLSPSPNECIPPGKERGGGESILTNGQWVVSHLKKTTAVCYVVYDNEWRMWELQLFIIKRTILMYIVVVEMYRTFSISFL